MINNYKLYSLKYLFLIILDFTLIITSKFASIFILEEKFYIKNGFFIELLISLTTYLILFIVFKVSRDSLRFYGLKLLINLLKVFIFYAFFYILLYKYFRSISIIEVINKYWVLDLIIFFSLLFLSRISIFFYINSKQTSLSSQRITILFDSKFNLENVIKLKEFISDYKIEYIINLDEKDISRKIDDISYIDFEKSKNINFSDSDTFLVISEQSSSYIQIDKIISSYNCKASQIKILNNLNFNLSTLLLNDNKQIFTDIHLENLLQRERVLPINDIYRDFINKKKILIIGAGGSIGTKIYEKILNLNPSKIVLLDYNEESIFNLQQIDQKGIDVDIYYVDVSRKSILLNSIFESNNVDIIFNAAANKHVKIFNENLTESIRNTINICENSISLALKFNTANYVLISSDKAINPTTNMGKIKKICEKICISNKNPDSNTIFSCVRFGNVLGSSGSVVPLFEKLVNQRKSIYVRHPDLTRFFMSIDEAAELVIHACALSKKNEIYTLDMGNPVKIYDLAKKIISLKGLTVKDENNPNGDIEIKFSHLLDGEKIHEEIFTTNKERTIHPKIFKDSLSFDGQIFSKELIKLYNAIENNEIEKYKDIINKLCDI